MKGRANRKRPLSWPNWFYYRSKRYGYTEHFQTYDASQVAPDWDNVLAGGGQGLWLADNWHDASANDENQRLTVPSNVCQVRVRSRLTIKRDGSVEEAEWWTTGNWRTGEIFPPA